jgi:hypothetical protein
MHLETDRCAALAMSTAAPLGLAALAQVSPGALQVQTAMGL